MIEYSIREDGIILIKFSGPTTFAEIKEYLEKFKQIKTLPDHIKLLYDFRGGEINFAEEDLVNIARLADEATVNYKGVRTAFITGQPDTTAFTFIFSQLKKHPHIKRHVFSTMDAALNWLKS